MQKFCENINKNVSCYCRTRTMLEAKRLDRKFLIGFFPNTCYVACHESHSARLFFFNWEWCYLTRCHFLQLGNQNLDFQKPGGRSCIFKKSQICISSENQNLEWFKIPILLKWSIIMPWKRPPFQIPSLVASICNTTGEFNADVSRPIR